MGAVADKSPVIFFESVNENSEWGWGRGKGGERMGGDEPTETLLLLFEWWGGKKKEEEKNSGDCTTVATQPRQLHYSNNLSKKHTIFENVCLFESMMVFRLAKRAEHFCPVCVLLKRLRREFSS